MTRTSCFPFPAGSLPTPPPLPLGPLWPAQLLCLGQAGGGGGGGGREHLAQLIVCQESNITRGLAWFQVFPGAFPCSVVKFLARISWLWERLSACLSLLGLGFIYSCLALTG